MNWWQNLTGLQQFLWLLALLSSGFFVSMLFSVLDIDGLDGFEDTDPSDSELLGDILQYLSIRNVAAFSLGFSWTSIVFYGQLGAFALLPGLTAGASFAALNGFLMRHLKRLESSGNLNLVDAIGQDARVSIQIDPHKQSSGKVLVTISGREVERLALTDDGLPLKRGDIVQVYDVEADVLLVSKEDKLGIRMLRS